MKKIFPLALICTLLCSCGQAGRQQPAQQETPKALQDGSGYASDLLSKSRYEGNLPERLYQELAAGDSVLTELETAVEELAGRRQDSLKRFWLYDNKNKAYYDGANQYLAHIKDTTLRLKMKALLTQSLASYTGHTAVHTTLLQLIDSSRSDLADIHYALKIVKTLPVIERFQKENIPAKGSLQNLLQAYRETITRMSTQIHP